AERGEDARGPEVRQPAGIFDSVADERLARVLRIAHAVDARAQAEVARGLEEELVQLAVALLVSPVADPHQVAFARNAVERVEDSGVRRFVKRPGALDPSAAEV